MILGLGIDVIEVSRIEEAMANPRFRERILTPAEQLLDLNPMRLAGRWAAKEAVAKALPFKLSWQDVEILNEASGQPQARVNHLGWRPEWKLMISITHERGIAAAVAILMVG